jgi:hypothetical protein
VRGFKEVFSSKGIATPSDAPVVIDFSGRVFARGQSKMDANMPGFAEAGWVINGRLECQSCQGANAWNCHEPAASSIAPNQAPNQARQHACLFAEHAPGFEQWNDEGL